jgi:hypothetical protein
MDREKLATYPPLNTLKAVASEVWIVDGPIIRFGLPWMKLSFPTRMTVIRLGSGKLFLHSPTPLVPELKREIESIGTPRWIVGPNRLHYWWIPEWPRAYPEASVYLAPRIREQAGSQINFPAHELKGATGYPWDGVIATLPVRGSYMDEFEFYHRPSRTLILTDLIENFEPRKLGLLMRWLTRLGGVQDPDGQMPRDMRLTFSKDGDALRHAVDTMIAWEPERVVLAHGRWYETNGTAELRRAFRWLLQDQ